MVGLRREGRYRKTPPAARATPTMAGLRYWPRGPVNGLNILEAAGGPGLSAEALLGTGADAVGFDTGVAMVDLERERWGSETSIDQARRLVVIPGGRLRRGCLRTADSPRRRSSRRVQRAVSRRASGWCADRLHPAPEHRVAQVRSVLLRHRPETDTWRLHDGDQHVRFWREPLSALWAAAAPWPVPVHYLVSHEQGCDTPAAWIRRFPS